MNTSKKSFWTGFVIGLLYFLATYFYEVIVGGCPWDLGESMCGLAVSWGSLPSVLLVDTILPDMSSPAAMILVALVDGIILGFVFVGIKKIFNKLFKK